MVDLGYQRAYMRSDGGVIGILEECPFGRHRPRRSSDANIWESLLDANGPRRSFHDKYQIEISIADLAHLPIFCPVAEKRANVSELCQ